MEHVGPFTFIAVRFALGALTLVPVILLQSRQSRKGAVHEGEMTDRRARSGRVLWTGGILCGTALMIASSLQQFGIMRTTVGKAGFITAMYIIIVPILGIFTGRKIRPHIWLCVLIAVAGLYLLSMNGSFVLQDGDALCLACAFVFAVQIMLIDHFADRADGVRLSAIQFLTASVLGTVMMFIFEKPSWTAVQNAGIPILYTGIMSSAVGYTLQIYGQRDTDPTVASLLMCLESVFAVLTGAVLLGERMSGWESAGCVVMFAAVILAQLSPVLRAKKGSGVREQGSGDSSLRSE